MALRAIFNPTFQPSFSYGLLRHISAPSILQQYSEGLLRPFAITIPWTISDIWESVLRAVPKKKSSYSKKRSRQMAGKALEDVTALNTCSGCGKIKKAHTLCPHCVQAVGQMKREIKKELETKETERMIELERTFRAAEQGQGRAQIAAGPRPWSSLNEEEREKRMEDIEKGLITENLLLPSWMQKSQPREPKQGKERPARLKGWEKLNKEERPKRMEEIEKGLITDDRLMPHKLRKSHLKQHEVEQ